jgi:serine O-acetyltransferase|tara:strand:- start:2261 stop:2854 length:594 start_codon:yes stop_codon:yes gene_type:complete
MNAQKKKFFYLKQDSIASKIDSSKKLIRLYNFLFNPVWRFHVLLRNYEYYKFKRNKSLFNKLIVQFLRLFYRRLSIKLGFTISPGVFGPGLCIPHYGSIVVNANSKIGSNCLIHNNVVIGTNGGSSKAPIIGDNVFIGPGAKIFGEIFIASGTYIGANSVLNKSITKEHSVVVGIPGKYIKEDKVVWWKKNNVNLNF